MNYNLTAIRENVIAIHDDEGKLLAVNLGKEIADILYLDMDETMLHLGEQEATKAGKLMITFDFYEGNQEYEKFLSENGFRIDETGSILAVPVRQLFSSGIAEELARKERPGATWISFRDMIAYQARELLAVIVEGGSYLKKEELLRFNDSLSGVLYDENGEIAAYCLVSEEGRDLVFDALFSVRLVRENMLAALYSVAKEMLECEIEENFERILLPDADLKVISLIKELLRDKVEIGSAGSIVSARKKLSHKSSIPNLPKLITVYSDEGKTDRLFTDKISRLPLQSSINFNKERI